MSKIIEKKISDLIGEDIDKAGYDLVRVHLSGGGKYSALQVMAERRDDVGMKVEDCAVLSKLISARLDADKDLSDKYDLEVSSPGIDRPLVKLSDYERFEGHVAKIELETAVDGQKRFQGRIMGVSNDFVRFDTEKGVITTSFATIEKAKLVLTDDLLKASKTKVNR